MVNQPPLQNFPYIPSNYVEIIPLWPSCPGLPTSADHKMSTYLDNSGWTDCCGTGVVCCPLPHIEEALTLLLGRWISGTLNAFMFEVSTGSLALVYLCLSAEQWDLLFPYLLFAFIGLHKWPVDARLWLLSISRDHITHLQVISRSSIPIFFISHHPLKGTEVSGPCLVHYIMPSIHAGKSLLPVFHGIQQQNSL